METLQFLLWLTAFIVVAKEDTYILDRTKINVQFKVQFPPGSVWKVCLEYDVDSTDWPRYPARWPKLCRPPPKFFAFLCGFPGKEDKCSQYLGRPSEFNITNPTADTYTLVFVDSGHNVTRLMAQNVPVAKTEEGDWEITFSLLRGSETSIWANGTSPYHKQAIHPFGRKIFNELNVVTENAEVKMELKRIQ
ncbi:unnamed protein product [Bursaphelenchus xylophilus]|uniref:(pine wood nematode) hypothetical protein n=1 Tax=Bursaphelenchus xylophilus TaxID=6326 RepID=A0A1I7RV35_BURXY|nr:unnamed protein product [Bursaphelenchus xylophilus]CAG9105151.1 unnamed protein product [Bursaphelenchus xylophilus]